VLDGEVGIVGHGSEKTEAETILCEVENLIIDCNIKVGCASYYI